MHFLCYINSKKDHKVDWNHDTEAKLENLKNLLPYCQLCFSSNIGMPQLGSARLGTFTARLARTHHYANTHFKGLSGNQASAATNFSFIISWWLKHSEPKEGFKIGSIHLLQKYMYFLTNFEKKFSLWSKFFYSCVSLAQVHYCIWKAPESCA